MPSSRPIPSGCPQPPAVRALSLFAAPAAALLLMVGCSGKTSNIDEAARTAADASVVTLGYGSGDSADSVTKDLTLPSVGGAGGSAITWSTSNAAVVTATGKVTRPPVGADATVTLTATATYGAAQASQAFVLKVKQVDVVQFIFTSDCHFGDVTSATAAFQGATAPVDALVVNSQARDAMNRLPVTVAPADYGVGAGTAFGTFDFMVTTGDIASKSVIPPLSNGNPATTSFAQWESVYVGGLTLKDRNGAPLPHYLTPGNHDVGNALGGPEIMNPAADATAFVQIYNRTMNPNTPLTTTGFNYNLHKVFAVKAIGGVHCVFLNMWLDAEMREKLEPYLAGIPSTAPVVIFAHMPPEQNGANFRDPASTGMDFPWAGGFSNLFRDKLDASDLIAPASRITAATAPTKEVQDLATFLKAHKNIVAWFHGHDNFNQFRTWNGENAVSIDNTMVQLSLPVFRVDSPMKGKDSAKDPKKLSFQVVSIDTAKKLFTVRECLWNKSNVPGGAIAWGATETFPLAVRVR